MQNLTIFCVKKLCLPLFFLFLFVQIGLSQTGFRYQAVLRNTAGQVLASQTVKLRMGIIQTLPTNPSIYTETHTTTTDSYGQVSLTIGGGTLVSGAFTNIDWSKTSFLKVEMDATGGTNYMVLGTTELLSVPKAMYAEKSGNSNCGGLGLCVLNYGAKGDNTTDDTNAFTTAIAAAAITGKSVSVPAGNYRITSTLIIPDGVQIVGEGVGSTPVGTPYNGSAIRYDGTGYAIQISGYTSGLRDLVVFDKNQGSTNASGVRILADARLVESVRMENVLISYFVNGTGLKLESINAGGIGYATFYDVRVRHAKIGYHIYQDGTSFTNSNVWHHGTISGGGFDYCLLVDGGNNNQFYGTIMEPYTSSFGHLVVNQGQITAENIRIEGSSQAVTTPLLHFKPNTRNSTVTGVYGGGLTLDEGNNFIGFKSIKTVIGENPSSNLFENATFSAFDGTNLPFWTFTGTPTLDVQSPVLSPQHNVLKVTIPAGATIDLKPAPLFNPLLGSHPMYGQVNFGMYVKTDKVGFAEALLKTTSGIAVSSAHKGDNNWHFVGMNGYINPAVTLDARMHFDNSTGGTAVDVYLTMPTMNFGTEIPNLDPKPISTAGGIMTGTLSEGLMEFTPNATYIVLPKSANTFIIKGTQAIHRINYVGGDKFPQGTILHLLFDSAGVLVLNSAYVTLKTSFTSAAGGSLTLVSLGNGTWRELDRN